MEVNIEKIMDEIRQDIQEKGYKETDLSFNDIRFAKTSFDPSHDFFMDEYLESMRHINGMKAIPDEIQILGKGKGIKKVMAKLTNFAIIPRFAIQNNYNLFIKNAFNEMTTYVFLQEATIRSLNRRIEKLEKQLEEEKNK